MGPACAQGQQNFRSSVWNCPSVGRRRSRPCGPERRLFLGPSRLSESATVRLAKGGEELRKRDVEPAGEPVQHVEGGRLLAALQLTQVGPVHPGPVREFLLGDPQAPAQFFESASQRLTEILHVGIVAGGRLPEP